MNAISKSMVLEPRNEHFHFKTAERDWHGGDPVKTIIFNAFSIMFPEGEKFFIDSVRNVRDQIDDPVLKKQIKGFIGQEAVHTREHIEYNKQLDLQGYSATKLDAGIRKRMAWVRRNLNKNRQLAATCALEHFTAMMSDLMMSDPSFLEGADSNYQKVWLWHAMEEAEHKGVAFDTLKAVTKNKDYFLRCRSMLISTVLFNYFILNHIAVMLKDRGLSRSPKIWWQVVKFLFGKPGLYRRMALPWFSYFKPSFHPWDHDNRSKVAKTEQHVLGDGQAYA
ncbi:MAG: metal-dependent hydrolase [Parasphingorhabdus sp.]